MRFLLLIIVITSVIIGLYGAPTEDTNKKSDLSSVNDNHVRSQLSTDSTLTSSKKTDYDKSNESEENRKRNERELKTKDSGSTTTTTIKTTTIEEIPNRQDKIKSVPLLDVHDVIQRDTEHQTFNSLLLSNNNNNKGHLPSSTTHKP